MPPLWLTFTALILFPAFYALSIWDARLRLRSWAKQEGLQLLQIENRLIQQGSFRHWMSARQIVFFIRALDGDRKEKSGFVCCGHYLWGPCFGPVEARWSDEPIQSATANTLDVT